MMATLSHSFSATSRIWVEKKMAPPCVAVLSHELLQEMRRFRVETDERFIHNDELRPVKKGGDECQLLLHAVRVGANGLCQIFCDFKQIGISADPFLPFPLRNSVNIRDKIEIADSGEKIVKIRIVRNIGQFLFAGDGLFADRKPADFHAALLEAEDTAAAFYGRGFTGPVMSDKAENLSSGVSEGSANRQPCGRRIFW